MRKEIGEITIRNSDIYKSQLVEAFKNSDFELVFKSESYNESVYILTARKTYFNMNGDEKESEY